MRELRAVEQAPQRAELRAAVGVAAVSAVREHILMRYGSYRNRLGGTSTQYYARMSDAVTATVTATGPRVSIPFPGAALHYYGGTVRPSGRISAVTGKPIQFLTIPKVAAAHGKRASDFRALYAVRGGLRLQQGAVRSAADPLYFIFARSATIKPDKGLLPEAEVMEEWCSDAVEDTMDAIRERPATPNRRRRRNR